MKIPRLLARPFARSHMPGFDPLYYRYWYRDVADFPGGPLAHYLEHGWREGCGPSAGFSTDGYLQANPDVRAAGRNPLLHFLETGLCEGRRGYEKDAGAPAPMPRPVEPPPKLLSPPRENVSR